VFLDLAIGLAAISIGRTMHVFHARQQGRAIRNLLPQGQSKRTLMYRVVRVATGLALIIGLTLPMSSLKAQEGKDNEYRAKANFLGAFPNFIEWPDEAFSSEKAPLLICVVGDFSFGTSLAELTRGASIRGRRIEVRWAHKEQELRACHILFVNRSETARYTKIFKAIEGASVLTVGETPNFLTDGGAIDFVVEKNKLQFEVNMGAAEDAHLRISSNMLALARHVVTRLMAAKS
jgi:hypothetical protein